jgi:uncharacterized membrane protein YfcA
MNSQNLLKLFALISLIASVAATVIWRQTGEAPSPWLIRTAIAALAAALVVFVLNQETRPRIMLQFVAAVFAVLAFFTFASDFSATHSATSGLHSLSLLERLNEFAPSAMTSFKAVVIRALGASAWDPVLTSLLGLPAYLVFAGLAGLCGYAGRPRREVRIFVN